MSADSKDCSSCLNRCMDMDMTPYCAAKQVLLRMPYGSALTRRRPIECAGENNAEHKLWELDTRRQKAGL